MLYVISSFLLNLQPQLVSALDLIHTDMWIKLHSSLIRLLVTAESHSHHPLRERTRGKLFGWNLQHSPKISDAEPPEPERHVVVSEA